MLMSQVVARSSVVGAFVNPATLDSIYLSLSEGRGAQLELRHVRDLSDLRALLDREVFRCLIVEPAVAGVPEGIAELASIVLHAGRRDKLGWIVLYASVGGEAVRFVHRFSALSPAELVLEQVDGADELRRAVGVMGPRTVADRALPYQSALLTLPVEVRAATIAALQDPRRHSVKTIAATAHRSVRTIERCFERAGLPYPRELLREARDRA